MKDILISLIPVAIYSLIFLFDGISPVVTYVAGIAAGSMMSFILFTLHYIKKSNLSNKK